MQGRMARRQGLCVGAQSVMIDGFLVAVTIFSLSMATIMVVITWRLIRLDRHRTSDRTAVRPRVTRQPEELTDTSPAPAWPPVRRDGRMTHQVVPRQSVAIPGAGASDPQWTDFPIRRTTSPVPDAAVATRQTQEAPALVALPVSSAGDNRRFALTIGVGALVIISVIGLVLVIGARPAASADLSPAAARVATPLELVSLTSARDGDRVTIRGTVRNPAAGTRVEHLQAVLFLFDRRGVYVGTTHAVVVQGVLAPGSESPFEIPLGAGLQVSRYRVSFRVATAPVPHIDCRPRPVPAPAGNREAAAEQSAVALGTPEPRQAPEMVSAP